MDTPNALAIPSLVVAGLDFGGFGGDPTAIEVGFRFGEHESAVWVNAREVYEKVLPIPDLVRVLQKWVRQYRIQRVWCDHSQPAAVELLVTYGIPALANQRRDVSFGVATVYALAKTSRWRNNPSACPRLEEELSLYSWGRDRKGEQKTKTPEDRYNHGIDCVRYYLTGEGETPEGATPPEDRAAMFIGPDGRWRDDPIASMARKMKGSQDQGLWWDETLGADGNSTDRANTIRQYLGMSAIIPDEDEDDFSPP